MKDAKGHGSDSRGGGGDYSVNDRLKRPRIGMDVNAVFSSRNLKPNLLPSEGQRTVNNLRNQMNGTGPGHQMALGQAVRNLLGV
jgi:hypothetical protein